MSLPERSPARDAALDTLLAQGGGWSIAAMRALPGLQDADLLFPGGMPDVLEALSDLFDRRMERQAATAGLESLRVSQRVRGILAIRLTLMRPHRFALGRAAGVLVMRPALAARCNARTADAIWHAAGDDAADFSWYTKRVTLTAIVSATLLFWLRDDSEDETATLEFLDRRLAGVGRIGSAKRRVSQALARFRPGAAAA